MSINYLVAEFWDCHYELFDSYLSHIACHHINDPATVTFFVPDVSKAAGQTLLTHYHPLISVCFTSATNDILSISYDLLIVNTSHVHRSALSFERSINLVNQIRARRCVVICHNSYDLTFCKTLNRDVIPLALSIDCCSYFNLNHKQPGNLSIGLYQPYSNYSLIESVRNSLNRQYPSSPTILAINGMLREGKGFKYLTELLNCLSSVHIHVIGSASLPILRQSGLYRSVELGLVDSLLCSSSRLPQVDYLGAMTLCDAILDLKPYPSLDPRESTSGNLQLSRSLALPIISHANTYLNEFAVRFTSLQHLVELLQSPHFIDLLRDHRRQLLHKISTGAYNQQSSPLFFASK